MNGTMRTLIIYDIPSDSERRKFAKCLQKYGNRVQKSAFEGWLDETKYKRMTMEIKQYGKNEENNIRIYRLSERINVLEVNSAHSEPPQRMVIV